MLVRTRRAPKGSQHLCHWSKVKQNIAVWLYKIDELHRSTKSPSKISARIAGLAGRCIPFVLLWRSTMFTRMCFPISKTGTPKIWTTFHNQSYLCLLKWSIKVGALKQWRVRNLLFPLLFKEEKYIEEFFVCLLGSFLSHTFAGGKKKIFVLAPAKLLLHPA